MAKKFEELRKKMSPERRARHHKEVERLLAEMPLQQLRAARKLTQQQMAELLEVHQSEISKIEKRTDMYLSTLASYVKAMGGTLELHVVFPLKGSLSESINLKRSTSHRKWAVGR